MIELLVEKLKDLPDYPHYRLESVRPFWIKGIIKAIIEQFWLKLVQQPIKRFFSKKLLNIKTCAEFSFDRF